MLPTPIEHPHLNLSSSPQALLPCFSEISIVAAPVDALKKIATIATVGQTKDWVSELHHLLTIGEGAEALRR